MLWLDRNHTILTFFDQGEDDRAFDSGVTVKFCKVPFIETHAQPFVLFLRTTVLLIWVFCARFSMFLRSCRWREEYRNAQGHAWARDMIAFAICARVCAG